MGAGVENIVFAPDLPSHAVVTRVVDRFGSMIAAYVFAELLARVWRRLQRERRWEPSLARTLGGRTFSSSHGRLGAIREGRSIAKSSIGCSRTAVNVGRGALARDPDLVEVLEGGRPGAAILDVFAREPLPVQGPLWTLDRVVVTPTASARTERKRWQRSSATAWTASSRGRRPSTSWTGREGIRKDLAIRRGGADVGIGAGDLPMPGYRLRFLDGRTVDVPGGEGPGPGAVVEAAVLSESLPSGGVRYRLEIRAQAELLDVAFPVLRFREGGDLLLSLQGGARVTDAREAIRRAGGTLALTYPGPLTMQFWQYADVYVATDDTQGLFKRWEFTALADGSLEAALVQPTEAVRFYETPYGCLVEPGFDSAFACAEHYRAWALRQPWCARGRLDLRASRGDIASWLLDTDLWMWNRGTARNIERSARDVQERVGGRVAALWYWWHGCSYDDGFPDYLPPREGWDRFDACIRTLHDLNVPLSVYVNGRLCGIRSQAFADPEVRDAAVRTRQGDVPTEVYNRFTEAPMAVMCPADPRWRKVLADTALELFEQGLDGVYIDQIGLSAPPRCYSESHGHPPGSAAAGVAGYRTLLEDIRSVIGRGRSALFTESCAEVYLDLFDGFFVLDTSLEKFRDRRGLGRNLEYVPLWARVYREYGLSFGSYASVKGATPFDPMWAAKSARPFVRLERDEYGNLWLPLPPGTAVPKGQLTWELGRALTFGNMPMLANLTREDMSDVVFDTVLEAVRAYRAGRPCFLFGRSEGPDAGAETLDGSPLAEPMPVRWLAKWLYCLPGEELSQERVLPRVTAGTFAYGGEKVTVFANHTEEPVKVEGLRGEDVVVPGLGIAYSSTRTAPVPRP